MKSFLYAFESALLRELLGLLRLLPLDTASAFGGKLGMLVGPFFSAHKTALLNLQQAFPERDAAWHIATRRKMWEQLGRVAAEFAFLPGDKLTSRVRVSGAEYLPQPGQAVLFFSAHIGNWELCYPIAFDRGVPTAIIYRHINNPQVDKLVADTRQSHATTLITKGIKGSVQIIKALRRGESLAMLVDQKMNNGMAVPFFGRDAMTATATAELSLKYNLPIIPCRIVRTGGAHFEGIIYPPLQTPNSGNHEDDVRQIMTQINQTIEGWVREHPEQWFWVHKRWPKA